MKKFILLLLFTHVEVTFADDQIYLDNQQLNEAKQSIMVQGATAINLAPTTQAELAQIKIPESNVNNAKKQLSNAQGVFKNAPKLQNKLPSGESYTLYSDSIVSDSKQYLAQTKNPLDINEAISNYNQLSKNAKAQIGDSRLLIFISSSLPKKTIINLMQQGDSIGATFVVRGMINGSFVNTYKYFYKFKEPFQNVAVMINPTLFEAFGVQEVPTFALYKSSTNILTQACKVVPVYAKVSGEMTVRHALEVLRDSKNNDISKLANNQIALMDSNGFYKTQRQGDK